MLSGSVMYDSLQPCQAPLSMGIPQARISEWVTMPFSRVSSQARDRSKVSCIAGGFFTVWVTRKAQQCSNYVTIALISDAIKIMLKILKLGFSIMWTGNCQMYKLDLEKAEKPEIKLATSTGS